MYRRTEPSPKPFSLLIRDYLKVNLEILYIHMDLFNQEKTDTKMNRLAKTVIRLSRGLKMYDDDLHVKLKKSDKEK
jgi:hypothetical protein